MGTEARVVLYAADELQARKAAEAAFGRIADIEDVLSDYRVDSEVVQLREAPIGVWIKVSDDLNQTLCIAESVREWTGGAFDVRCGRATQLWRHTRSLGQSPAALPPAQMATLEMDRTNTRIRLHEPMPWLDFGGIGKGWAADEAMHVLAQHGVSRAMVDIGGDIALGAAPPGHDGWRIQRSGTSQGWVLADCGVATSGDREQHIDGPEGFWSHLWDPRSGLWVGRHPDVTIIAPTAALADALASAACVMGAADLRVIVQERDDIEVVPGTCRP